VRAAIFKPCLLAAAVALTLPHAAQAAGLGRLAVHSTLGQPLSAEIELHSVGRNELSTLAARIATPEAYQRANVPYNSALAGARMSVEKRPDGQHYLKAVTSRAVTEPYVELMVELTWQGGSLVRQYTALLDPPGFGQSADALGTPVPTTVARAPAPPVSEAPVTELSPVQTASSTRAEARASAPRDEGAASSAPWVRQYGPVERGETLGSIARVVRYDDATVEQTMVGLHRHNPEAFIRNNMNLLRTGRILQVPEPIIMSSIPQRLAVREIRLQTADWESFRARLAQRAAPAREAEPPPAERIDAQSAQRPPIEGRDVVRLSRGDAAPAAKGATAGNAERVRSLEEDAIASRGALAEANERIAQLESTLRDMHRLMEAKGGGAGAVAAQGATPASMALPVEADAPAPARRIVRQSAAQAEPSLMEAVLGNALFLAAGGGALMLGLGFWLVRRRRAQATEADAADELDFTLESRLAASDEAVRAKVLALGEDDDKDEAVPARSATVAAATAHQSAFKEAAEPADDRSFEALSTLRSVPAAAETSPRPGSVEAQNPLTQRTSAPDAGSFAGPAAGEGVSQPAVAFDLEPPARTSVPSEPPPAPLAAAAEGGPNTQQEQAPLPVFSLEEWTSEPVQPEAPRAAPELPPLDFGTVNFAPPAASPEPELPPLALSGELSAPAREFEQTLKELELDFDGPSTVPTGPARDPRWHDVQQKFDLAKAYEEMGDKNGARDVLQEVLKEGDPEQRAHATVLMQTLS
jgi:pilus assembly protein FimV